MFKRKVAPPRYHSLFEEKAHVFEKFHEPVNYRDTWQIFRIMSEFVAGYQLLGKFEKTATIFGSARSTEDSFAYKEARKCGELLGKEGYAVITGGGPGVMEAGNRGAQEVGAESVAISIQLPEEQILNPYVTKNEGFNYFFIRKVMLVSPAEAAIFFPGGYGTMDEIFELLDLIEIGKIKKIPVIAVGKDFWNPLVEFLKQSPKELIGAIGQSHLDLLRVVDSAEEAVTIVRNSGVHKVLCDPSDPTDPHCAQTMNWRIFRIMAEVVEGFEFLTREVRDDVTILGTNSLGKDDVYYQAAEKVAFNLGKNGYMVVTGGGTGIMEGANKGAKDAGAESIGFSLKFDDVARTNPYLTKSLSFNFPYIRKLVLTVPSKAFIFFPGGFGTLHQLFEVLTLMKTKKMQEMTLILYGKKYWQPLDNFIRETLLKKYDTIAPEYVDLYKIVDSVEEVDQYISTLKK
ncbi:MAG: TIGR00730 family Rossman fold protein [Candidatus Magasanikbacteria bacterium]|nr:TIGR00730 family Rossman fold protein [Candidatus Magasanikbacteria bacterium]